jgi:hypothetical protein
MPMRYERLYSDYEVTGDTTERRAPRPPPVVLEYDRQADSATRAKCKEQGENVECFCRNGACRGFVVQVPVDTPSLLASAELPRAFAGPGDSLISGAEMDELTRAVGRLPAAPWQFKARPPRWGVARFNRVEGLSLGARGEVELGRLRLDGTARIATSDGEPDVDAGLVRESDVTRFRLGGYRRLSAADPTARSLGIGNSLNALLLGRDDGEYYRSLGVELTIVPAVTTAQRFSFRLYAEQQRNAIKRTDFSLPHAVQNNHVFRPNIRADSADQVGAAITFRAQRGFDPTRPQWSADVTIDGGAGTYGFGRSSATLRVAAPFGLKLAGAVELAGGMSAGRVPVQSLWYLGGPGTLRGYNGSATSGEAFWRARFELANQLPAARLVLFADLAKAAQRDRLSLKRPLAGVGIGASFMDGLLRLDVARGLRSPTGWRVDFYTDAAL